MIQLMLTEEQHRVIDESSEPVPIVDLSGRVFATAMHGFTESEMKAIAEDARNFQPMGTLREHLDRLSAGHPVAAERIVSSP